MLLFTPGPTPVLEEIRLLMAQKTLHHRTPEFEAIFAATREKLLRLYGMHETIMLASSGTGAMEACVINLCAKKALTINAGKFGERFSKICKAYNKPYIELKYDWDTPADVNEIIDAIKKDESIDALFIQVCESSGGLRHPVEEIAREIKAIRPEVMIIADAITALGVEKIDISHIDALIGGSQKAFMLPPGLSFIGFSEAAVKKFEELNVGFYFNLKIELKNQRANTTAWTAATTLIIGLNGVLEMMFKKGLDELYKETLLRSNATKEALKVLGLKIYPKTPAISMTTIFDQTNAEAIRKLLKKEFKVNIAGGQDMLSGKIFRISHMGFIDEYEANWVVNSIELAMDKLGLRAFDGSANKRFLKTLYALN